MKIRPKIPIYLGGGVSGVGRTRNNWYGDIHSYQKDTILNILKLYDNDDYMNWLNAMQHAHSYIWNNNKDKMDSPTFDLVVLNYLRAYSGDSDYYPYIDPEEGAPDRPRWQLKSDTNLDFNTLGIQNAFSKGVFTYPGKRTSKDSPQWNYNPDGYFSGITDYRRLLGRKGDYTDEQFNSFKEELNKIGYDIYEDINDNGYYKLKRFEQVKSPNDPPLQDVKPEGDLEEKNKLKSQETGDPPEKESFLNKLSQGFNKIAPDLLEGLRLAGALGTNSRVFRESEKAIIPNLLLTYQTHRQVVGDEATKQAYYRRAAQGQTRAALPFTADADRLMAYMQEARRVGDELRALGDLADNQEIRRTSDESNQHEWANTQRATEVANSNITELNKADAAKHLLRALKYFADWTNIDLYLLGRQAKIDLKRNKELAYQQLLQLLEDLHEIASDEKLLRLKSEASAAYDTYYKDTTNTANYNLYKSKLKAYQDYLYEVLKRILSRRQFAKSGTKLEYKDKTAKFLYKTSKDIVEHFRKMSKMTDDSRVRTLPKPIKLSSHPRKMLMGGVAPFYIYRPYMSGMELSMSSLVSSSGTSSSSKKDNEGKDKLDMIKELFKAIQGQGLPIDVSTVYLDISKVLNKAKAFGEDLSTDDIASMYLNSMLKINNLKYSKDVFDKAKAQATANDALNEYAVTNGGQLVLQNKEGEIKLGSYLDYVNSKGKWNPITNDQLLNLRAYSPNMALFKGDELMLIVNNGVGMTKIAAQIKSMASTLGSSELKIEGISEVENRRIKAGLQTLASVSGTPDGFYKITLDKKDSSANVNAALTYIYNMLPNNYKTVLKMHSGSEDNSKALIASMLSSQVSNYYKEDIAPLTGRAAKDDKDSSEKMSSNPLLARQREMGGIPLRYNIITRDSNTRISVNGTFYPSNPKIKDDTSIDNYLYESGIAGIMDSKYGITFGDLQISPEDLKNIMYSNTGEMIATLPCKIVNGHKLVNLEIKELYEEAEQAALNAVGNRESDLFAKKLGEELLKRHLDLLLDLNGLPNKNMFGQFLIVEAYATDNVKLDENSLYVEKVKDPNEQLEKRLSKALSTDSKKSDYKVDVKDKWLLFEWGYNNIYRGTIFIPLNNNPNAAMLSWGTSTQIGQQQDLEELYLIENKSVKYNSDNKLN